SARERRITVSAVKQCSIGGEMRAGSWNFWKVCPRVAPGILGVALVAMTGIAPQKVLAAGRAPHERSYFLYVGTYTGHNSKGIYQYRFDEKTGSLTAMEPA